MTDFDYAEPAELFFVLKPRKGAGMVLSRGRSVNYRRFTSAAAAIRFVMEEVSPGGFTSATMEVAEGRFEKEKIEMLYRALDYPLERA